ncbi:hypothetical protein Dimus_022873 [Dionaea muscipula]
MATSWTSDMVKLENADVQQNLMADVINLGEQLFISSDVDIAALLARVVVFLPWRSNSFEHNFKLVIALTADVNQASLRSATSNGECPIDASRWIATPSNKKLLVTTIADVKEHVDVGLGSPWIATSYDRAVVELHFLVVMKSSSRVDFGFKC